MARRRMDKKIKLPKRTKSYFEKFVNLANKQTLHPRDWERFHIFILACHEGNTKLPQGELKSLLIDNGFPEDNASSLSNIYNHGRDLLKLKLRVTL